MTASVERKERRAALVASLKARIVELEEELHLANLTAWSAQKGLAAYMQEHGLGHRINAEVLAKINAGPPVKPAPGKEA